MSQQRSYFEARELRDDAELEDVIREYNEFIKSFNFLTKQLSLQSNFDCQVLNIEVPATTNLRIFHRLGIVPKYRLILRQEGNGLLTDIPLEWNDKFITIRNNGAVVVKATIALLKE